MVTNNKIHVNKESSIYFIWKLSISIDLKQFYNNLEMYLV